MNCCLIYISIKLFLVVVIFSVLVTLYSVSSIEELAQFDDKLLLRRKLNLVRDSINKSAVKTIVLWNDRNGIVDWKISENSFKSCPEKRCKFVLGQDVVHQNLSDYDAFLFHASGNQLKSMKTQPSKRYPHQIYAFVSQEAPGSFQDIVYRKFSNFFNYTSEFLMICSKVDLKLEEFQFPIGWIPTPRGRTSRSETLKPIK